MQHRTIGRPHRNGSRESQRRWLCFTEKTLEGAEIASRPDLSMIRPLRLITQHEFETVGHQSKAINRRKSTRPESNRSYRKNASRHSHSPEPILCQRHAR